MLANRMMMAASMGAVPATIAFTANTASGSNATAFTFSSTAIGTAEAGRKVAVGVSGSNGTRTVSTLTVGGVSASLVKRQQNSGLTVEIWEVELAAGTSADIVVTWSGAQGNGCQICVFAIYGASTSAHDTGGATGDPATDTINIPAGGVALAHIAKNDAESWTWTGLTERYDAGSGNDYGGASDAFETAQTGLSVSADASTGGGTIAMAVASWGPA